MTLSPELKRRLPKMIKVRSLPRADRQQLKEILRII